MHATDNGRRRTCWALELSRLACFRGPISNLQNMQRIEKVKHVYMRKDLYSPLIETNVLEIMDVAFHVYLKIKNYTIVPVQLRSCVCVYIAIAAFRRVFAPARYLQS
jgi:hypothetical protein